MTAITDYEYAFQLCGIHQCPKTLAESGQVRIIGREFRVGERYQAGPRYLCVEHRDGSDFGGTFWVDESELKEWTS